jgi:Fibronectin type III domain
MLCPVGCCAKRNVLILFLLLCSAVLLKYSVIASQSVTLGWDPSSDPNSVAYNIYYGTVSHEYTTEVSAGNATSVVINGLIEGATYYFAATTYDVSGQESSFSDEVPYTVPIATSDPLVTNNCVAGQYVILKVPAGGTSPLTFEWRFNSTDIPAATNGSLTLNTITTNQAGTYSVTVSDDAGATTNLTIYLAVYPTAAATLTPATIIGGPFSFNVSGVPGFGYIVQASTNLADWESVQTNFAPFVFKDPDASLHSHRFYRTLSAKGVNIRFPPGPTISPGASPFIFVQQYDAQF